MTDDDIKFVIQTLRDADFSTDKQSSDQDKAVWIMMQEQASAPPPWVKLDVHQVGQLIDDELERDPKASIDHLEHFIKSVEKLVQEVNA